MFHCHFHVISVDASKNPIINIDFQWKIRKGKLNPFQSSAAFHMETSHLICSANQMTGFSMKKNTVYIILGLASIVSNSYSSS